MENHETEEAYVRHAGAPAVACELCHCRDSGIIPPGYEEHQCRETERDSNGNHRTESARPLLPQEMIGEINHGKPFQQDREAYARMALPGPVR